jgi:hypothetical protein
MADTDVLSLPTSAVVSNVQYFAPVPPAVREKKFKGCIVSRFWFDQPIKGVRRHYSIDLIDPMSKQQSRLTPNELVVRSI